MRGPQRVQPSADVNVPPRGVFDTPQNAIPQSPFRASPIRQRPLVWFEIGKKLRVTNVRRDVDVSYHLTIHIPKNLPARTPFSNIRLEQGRIRGLNNQKPGKGGKCQGRSESFPLGRSKKEPLRGREAPPRRSCSFVERAIEAVGKWETGKPAFGFLLFHPPSSPELWEWGISLVFRRDFQGARGKSGKPAFGFPRFPQARHFHSSLLLLLKLRASYRRAAGQWSAIANRALSSSCCSLVGSSPHSFPGCEHGGSGGPATRRSAALSPAPRSIRRMANCW
jgi:hypothetical protein